MQLLGENSVVWNFCNLNESEPPKYWPFQCNRELPLLIPDPWLYQHKPGWIVTFEMRNFDQIAKRLILISINMYGWLLTFWSWYSPFEGSGESIKGWWWQLEPFLHKEVNANDVYDSNDGNQNKSLCEYNKFPAVAGIHYYTATPFADSKPCLHALTSLKE